MFTLKLLKHYTKGVQHLAIRRILPLAQNYTTVLFNEILIYKTLYTNNNPHIHKQLNSQHYARVDIILSYLHEYILQILHRRHREMHVRKLLEHSRL